MKTIQTGTNHFDSINSAVRYYGIQGESKKEVLQRIEDKEIIIGRPEEKPGQKISIDKTGRYWIHEKN